MDRTLENILDLIGNKPGAQRAFTSTLGFCASTVADWKSGKSKSYTKHLPKIANHFGVSVDYLVSGNRDAAANTYPLGILKAVPVLGVIRAGTPAFASDNFSGVEYADVTRPEDYFYLRVQGDSMIGAGITDGSLVLVRRQPYAEPGQIVACLVGGEDATLKRYRKQDNTVILMPENPSYQPIILSEHDFRLGDAAILGVAVEVKKKLC